MGIDQECEENGDRKWPPRTDRMNEAARHLLHARREMKQGRESEVGYGYDAAMRDLDDMLCDYTMEEVAMSIQIYNRNCNRMLKTGEGPSTMALK